MAYLVIKKDNKITAQVDLNESKDYSIGRSKECDIHLDEVTISRQHLKIFYKENAWHVQSLSKYSPLYLNNEPTDYSTLKEGDSIRVVNYDISFFDNTKNLEEAAIEQTHTPFEQTPTMNLSEDLSEKTYIPETASHDWSIGIPFIVIKAPNLNDKTLRLDGDYWSIGRDEMSDITLDDPKSSREHCEIYQKNNNFYLLDKGSSNGTILNGQSISFKIEYPIISGDIIQIGQHHLIFEIRDPHFNEKIALIPYDKNIEQIHHYPAPHQPSEHIEFRRVQKISSPKKYAIKPLHYIIGLLAITIIYALLNEESTDTKNISSTSPTAVNGLQNLDPIENLAADQKEYVEKTYTLAQNLYKQGKYDLTLVEVEKIHNLVPSYKDSKDIQKFSKMAIDTLMEQNEIKRQEDEQKKIIAQTEQMISDCEKKYSSHKNSRLLYSCLEAPEEMDPENTRIANLKNLAEQNDLRAQEKKEQQTFYKNQVQKRKQLYEAAVMLEKKGKILDAISAHNRNIASELPDPLGLENKSKNEIIELNQKIDTDLKKYSEEAELAYSQKNYRAAITKLEDALKLNPQSKDIKLQHEKYFQELYKIMKILYGDSVLEENLGNIDSAKEKWLKIQAMDVLYGEYYKKSKIKLKKYGS